MPGIAAANLADADLDRELEHLHATRRETFLHGSGDALVTHTRRMLELEAEFLRRFPGRAVPHPSRLRETSRS